MIRVGVVAEGPRDYDLITAVIDRITGVDNEYLSIQPESDLLSELGNGWRGVWRWCEEHHDSLYEYINDIEPKLDLLIIQMDGDVCRKEKEVHCFCQRKEGTCLPDIHPLFCEKIKAGQCPVVIPCPKHVDSVDAYVEHLSSLIKNWLGELRDSPVCIVIPCDSSDSWIIAACEETIPEDGFETIPDSWGNIICHSPKYHEIKIKNRPHKNRDTYSQLIGVVCTQWNVVTQRCPQAKKFEEAILEFSKSQS